MLQESNTSSVERAVGFFEAEARISRRVHAITHGKAAAGRQLLAELGRGFYTGFQGLGLVQHVGFMGRGFAA